ncbi:class A beta-lactamase [Coralloluteibacterium thermophilus]|uniref:Beta-lactamase n=1 Tax=Coralloluteibacterium thermophilum TaxID=2707049 RepID=A0ABV9NHK0_9GAMM
MIDRRHFLATAGTALAAGLLGATPFAARAAGAAADAMDPAGLERRSGGRLGVAILDSGSGRRLAWRAEERFPMASTFKFLLAAAVLARVDRGEVRLDQPLRFGPEDRVSWSPVVEARMDEGQASVADLCEATVTWSDNAAANLLLGLVDGPAGLTRFLRGLGDPVTRLDRMEPELNSAEPGDPRDTTTPAAMVATLGRLLLGDVLTPASRAQLTYWLRTNHTGNARLRAGMPPGWQAGDKTGSFAGTANDVGILWPPGRPPVLVAAYLTGASIDGAGRDAVLADVGRLAVGLAAAG